MDRDTLPGALADIAAAHPDEIALVFENQRINYRTLQADADRLARALLASGVRKGDRVGMLCSTRPEVFALFLACGAVGAIFVGLGLRNQYDELRYVTADAEPVLLFSLTAFEGRTYVADVSRLKAETPSVREIVWLGGDAPDAATFEAFASRSSAEAERLLAQTAIAPQDPALIVYTSGTTGRPKGALLSHYGLIVGNREQAPSRYAIRPVTLNALPINHIACLGDTFLANMVAAGTTVLCERFRPDEQLALIARERVNIWGGIPAMLLLTLAAPEAAETDFSSVEIIGWGGNPMPREMIPRLRQLCPQLGTVYGLTETTVNVTCSDPDADDDTLAETIGRPIPSFTCRIVDEDGQICGPGQTGELQFHSAANMLGYWRRPEATAEAFTSDGWLRTGDLGYWREDGNITLSGRRSEMFKSGGFNVYPREVELAIETHPAVAASAVVGQPDPLYTEVGRSFVMLRPDSDLTADSLRAYLKERLANYKIPKAVVFLDMLPILPNGKFDKALLKRMAAEAVKEESA